MESENLTKEKIIETLKECQDPEIPISVWDLGLIYDIKITDENIVNIKMTLTNPACPMASSIVNSVTQKIKSIPGVKDCNVELIFEPAWTPERMSKGAKEKLNLP